MSEAAPTVRFVLVYGRHRWIFEMGHGEYEGFRDAVFQAVNAGRLLLTDASMVLEQVRKVEPVETTE